MGGHFEHAAPLPEAEPPEVASASWTPGPKQAPEPDEPWPLARRLLLERCCRRAAGCEWLAPMQTFVYSMSAGGPLSEPLFMPEPAESSGSLGEAGDLLPRLNSWNLPDDFRRAAGCACPAPMQTEL